MVSLYQRLKELSKDEFESLVDQLLQARFPNAAITRVNGSGGDGGVDSFSGRIGGSVAVWQAKHFSNGVGKPQRRNILESIKTTFENNVPYKWTLCVPINLTPSELKWFNQNIVDVHGTNCQIELMQASHIVQHLIHYKRVREAFFPEALQDATKLADLILRSNGLSSIESKDLGNLFSARYIDGLEEADGRLRYEVAVAATQLHPAPKETPNLLASAFDGKSRVDIFARDISALRDDPIRLLVTLSRQGQSKIEETVRTGKGNAFGPEDIVRVQMPAFMTAIVGEGSTMRNLVLEPNLSSARPIHTSIEILFEQTTIKYSLVIFKAIQVGTEELTLTSISKLPFRIRLRIFMKPNLPCEIEVAVDFKGGFLFREIAKALKFMDALTSGSALVINDLDNDRLLIDVAMKTVEYGGTVEDGMRKLVEHALIVSDYLGYELKTPSNDPPEEDYRLLEILKFCATGEDFEMTRFAFSLIKDSSKGNQLTNLIESSAKSQLILNLDVHKQVFVLFGEPIKCPPVHIQIDKAQLETPAKAEKAYESASEGQPVEIALRPTTARYIKPTPPSVSYSAV